MTTPADSPISDSALSWARRALKVTAAAADLVRRHPSGVVVLIYHRVGRRTSTAVDLPTAQFEEQMAELGESGRVITLDRAIDLLAVASPVPVDAGDGSGPPDMPVVVTFDDGTADLADLATPVLARHAVPASLYLATDFVDRSVVFRGNGTPLSWAAIQDMTSTGLWSIESHTHAHVLLDRAPDSAVAADLDRSIDLIAEHTGRVPRHFAYPKALAGTPSAERAVRARFRSAALAGTRVNVFGATDPWHLARTPIQVDDGMGWFRRKATGGMRVEDDLRRLLNRFRYRSAQT